LKNKENILEKMQVNPLVIRREKWLNMQEPTGKNMQINIIYIGGTYLMPRAMKKEGYTMNRKTKRYDATVGE